MNLQFNADITMRSYLVAAFSNQILGAATLDRLRHGAYRVVLDGKSYRSSRPMESQLEKDTETGK